MDPEIRSFRVFLGWHLCPVRVRIAVPDAADRDRGTRKWIFETLDGVRLGTVKMAADIELLHPSREELEQQIDWDKVMHDQLRRLRAAADPTGDSVGCGPGALRASFR